MKASVVIPTFNRASIILDTLESVLQQDYAPLEIIIVDDGSTDATAKLLESYVQEGRIRFIPQAHQGKPSPARNRGLVEATGDVVFIFDSDDLMLPGKISKTMSAIKELGDKRVGFCCTDFILRKKDGREESHYARNYYQVFRESPKNKLNDDAFWMPSRSAYGALLSANYVGTSSVAFPKYIIDAGFRFDESLTNSDDYDMWLRIARDYDVLIINKPLHVYVESGDSVLKKSVSTGSKWRTNINILKRELRAISDSELRKLGQKRLAENYRALFQCNIANKQWKESSKALWGALVMDASGSVRWIWKKVRRKMFNV